MTRMNMAARFAGVNVSRITGFALVCLGLIGCAPAVLPVPLPEPPLPTPDPIPGEGNKDVRASRLFVANFAGLNVVSYQDPWTVDGDVAPDTNLQGAQTQLLSPLDLTVDNSGALSVVNQGARSITSYADADTADGDLAPDRNVKGPASLLVTPRAMAHQPVGDLMFVLDDLRVINVFGDVSTAVFDEGAAPIRTIDPGAVLVRPMAMCFGDHDDLYVADDAGFIYVFAHASTLDRVVVPTRTIESPKAVDVFVERSSDTMFVVETTGFVYTYHDAATLDGAVEPDAKFQVPGAASLQSIAVDSHGTGYIVDALTNAIYSYDDVAELDGFVAPDRTIRGPRTRLNQPLEVYVFEEPSEVE